MEILKERTFSLCNICYEQIPAKIFQKNRQVFIHKQCSEHGEFEAIVEKDVDFYYRFAHIQPIDSCWFDTLVIPITFRCNLHCKYCYAPYVEREDLSLSEIGEIVNNFAGPRIYLSGGEPTLREDLESIINIVKEAGKYVGLVTNGIKLSDINYLGGLKKAGLNYVFFSFDSLREKTYNLLKMGNSGIKNINILDLKKKALINLEIKKIPTILNATIYPGLNDREFKDLFIFAMEKSGFIFQLRLRSCVKIGRFDNNEEGYFLSELFNLFSEQLNIDKKTLITQCLISDYHTPHHITFHFEGYLSGGDFVPYFRSKNRKHSLNKLFFALCLLKRIGIKRFLNVLKDKYIKHNAVIKKLSVRLMRWPTIENIDLQEVDREVAGLYDKNKILNFCHAIILDARPASISPRNIVNQTQKKNGKFSPHRTII